MGLEYKNTKVVEKDITKNGTGIDAQAREDITNLDAQLAQNMDEVKLGGIDPTNYGCVGDGVTDDTTAFKSLITSNTVIVLPSSKTFLLAPMTFDGLENVTIIGGNVKVKDSTDGTLFYFTNSKKIKILDVYMDGNHANIVSATAVWLQNCENSIVEGNTFYEFGKGSGSQRHICRVTAASKYCYVTNNTIIRGGGKGVDIFGDSTGAPSHIFVTKNRILETGHWGSADDALFGGNNHSTDSSENIVFTENYVDGSEGHGLRISGTGKFHVKIDKNTFKNCASPAISAKPQSTGSVIFINDNTCYHGGIQIAHSNHFKVTGNRLLNQDPNISNSRGFALLAEVTTLIYSNNHQDSTSAHKFNWAITEPPTISGNIGQIIVYEPVIGANISNHNGTITDSGVRTLINVWGENAGDPNSVGDWYGNGQQGVMVRDTTNSINYVYIGGTWVAI